MGKEKKVRLKMGRFLGKYGQKWSGREKYGQKRGNGSEIYFFLLKQEKMDKIGEKEIGCMFLAERKEEKYGQKRGREKIKYGQIRDGKRKVRSKTGRRIMQ